MSTNEDDYTRGYRDGYRDATEDSKVKKPRPNNVDPISWPSKISTDSAKCIVCGILFKNMSHYCCMNDRCPTKITFQEFTS